MSNKIKTEDEQADSSPIETIVINPIDEKYREIDDIRSCLDILTNVRQADDEQNKTAFEFFNYPKGKKLQLTVEVYDPDLVNVILSSEWGVEGLMPGMSVTDVRFSDLEREDVVADWLRQSLHELEQKGL